MLRRNMKQLSPHLRLGLEDLLGDLWHARRREDLGRLALVSYYEVRRWARLSGCQLLVERSSVLITGRPYVDRASFLVQVDALIVDLEKLLAADCQYAVGAPRKLRFRDPADQAAGASAEGRSAGGRGDKRVASTAGRRTAA